MAAFAALLAGGAVHGLFKGDIAAFRGPAQGMAFAAGVHGGMVANPAVIAVFFMRGMIKRNRRHGDFGLVARFGLEHYQGGIGLVALQAGNFPVRQLGDDFLVVFGHARPGPRRCGSRYR